MTEQQVFEELRDSESSRWSQALDFIRFLREQARREHVESGPRNLTTRTSSQSRLVGLCENREDVGYSDDRLVGDVFEVRAIVRQQRATVPQGGGRNPGILNR